MGAAAPRAGAGRASSLLFLLVLDRARLGADGALPSADRLEGAEAWAAVLDRVSRDPPRAHFPDDLGSPLGGGVERGLESIPLEQIRVDHLESGQGAVALVLPEDPARAVVVRGGERLVDAAQRLDAPLSAQRPGVELELELSLVEQLGARRDLAGALVVANQAGASSGRHVHPVDLAVQAEAAEIEGLPCVALAGAEARLEQVPLRDQWAARARLALEKSSHQRLDAGTGGRGARVLSPEPRLRRKLARELTRSPPPRRDGSRPGDRVRAGRRPVQLLQDSVDDGAVKQRIGIGVHSPGIELVVYEPPVRAQRVLLERRCSEQLSGGERLQDGGVLDRPRAPRA